MDAQMTENGVMSEQMTQNLTSIGAEKASEQTAAAFGLSAVVVIIFNTVLAWVKDAYDPLNTVMAHLTGHHWITHGLVDVILFFLLGWLFTARHTVTTLTNPLIMSLAVATIVGGFGLAAWFLFV